MNNLEGRKHSSRLSGREKEGMREARATWELIPGAGPHGRRKGLCSSEGPPYLSHPCWSLMVKYPHGLPPHRTVWRIKHTLSETQEQLLALCHRRACDRDKKVPVLLVHSEKIGPQWGLVEYASAWATYHLSRVPEARCTCHGDSWQQEEGLMAAQTASAPFKAQTPSMFHNYNDSCHDRRASNTTKQSSYLGHKVMPSEGTEGPFGVPSCSWEPEHPNCPPVEQWEVLLRRWKSYPWAIGPSS